MGPATQQLAFSAVGDILNQPTDVSQWALYIDGTRRAVMAADLSLCRNCTLCLFPPRAVGIMATTALLLATRLESLDRLGGSRLSGSRALTA